MTIDPRVQLNRFGGWIAILLIGLLAISLYALFRLSVPAANHDVLLVVIGMLTASVQTIVNWFYGSSSTARQKDATIDTLANTAQTAGAALSGNVQTTLQPGDTLKTAVTDAGATVTTTKDSQP